MNSVPDNFDEVVRRAGEALPQLRTDIQAILTVLGRRLRSEHLTERGSLDLSGTDLRRADLRDAHLQRAKLVGAQTGDGILLGPGVHRGSVVLDKDLEIIGEPGAALESDDLPVVTFSGVGGQLASVTIAHTGTREPAIKIDWRCTHCRAVQGSEQRCLPVQLADGADASMGPPGRARTGTRPSSGSGRMRGQHHAVHGC
jgi:hypothetical protein